jgi:hypothetical protein
MALPRLQLRRGTGAPSGSIAIVAEPFFDTTGQDFYVATSTNTFSKIGGSSYSARVDEFLTASVASTSTGAVVIKDAQATQNSVTIDVPSTVTTSYSFTLPAVAGTNGYLLQTDGSGNTSWVAPVVGYTKWTLSDGTNTQDVNDSDTVTITGGSGIGAVVSATDTLTINLDINELTSEAAIADADTFAFYDATAAANRKATADNLRDYVLGGVSGDIVIDASGVASIQANSVALGTDTTGNYVQSVATSTTGGLTGGVAAAEGTTPDIALKNNANFSANTVLKWDDTNNQFVNSLVSDDGSTVTIAGNLTINGTTTTVNTTNTSITDRLIELAAGTTGAPTADSGIVIIRGDLDNVFVGYDEGADVFVAGTTTGTGTSTDLAPTPVSFLAKSYVITDAAGTGEEVIGYLAAGGAYSGSAAGRYLQNVIVDFGTY